jgi:carbonic anhydrase
MDTESTDRPQQRQANFEVTGRDQPGGGHIGTALDRNRAFAASGGHKDAVVFPNLGLFVITCLDPRVDPAHFLGLELSDAMVVRNVGGRVTPEVINDVAYISQLAENVLPDGPLFEVAVIHHTQCGAGAFADDNFRHRYAQRIGADEAALRDHAVLDPAATVTTDVERPAVLLRDPPARHRIRARLRRRHRRGPDDRPGQLTPEHQTTRVAQRELVHGHHCPQARTRPRRTSRASKPRPRSAL